MSNAKPLSRDQMKRRLVSVMEDEIATLKAEVERLTRERDTAKAEAYRECVKDLLMWGEGQAIEAIRKEHPEAFE